MVPAPAMRGCARVVGVMALCLWPGLALGQSAPPPSRDAGMLAAAMTAAAAGDWSEATVRAAASKPIAGDLVTWMALRAGEGDFAAYRAFLDSRAHWPLINTVQRQAEALLPRETPETVLAFFADREPLSPDGHLARLFALDASGARDEAAAHAARLWQEMPLDGEAELRLLRNFADALAPHHANRVSMLLWEGQRNAARRHLDRLSAGERALARARIAVQEGTTGVDALVAEVPASLASDAGLMHDRFQFRLRAGNTDGAAELMLAQSRDAAGLGRPEAWGPQRIRLVRGAMAEGDYAEAYELATPHGLSDGLFFVDLEFLAGFIALIYLDRPEDALQHFRALRVRSTSPISLGRAGYWEGRAHEALGDDISAQAAFEFGAEHQSGFYGQMAADRLGHPLDEALLDGPAYPDWRETTLAGSDLLQAALLLREAGEGHEARRFVLFLARQIEDEATLGALADLMLELGEPNFALNIAKIAVQSELILPRAYFPLTDLAKADLPVPMDLVKAIARRESEFDAAVVSPADARGLMQVLPGTGQMMADRLDIPFEARDLTRDPELNARLGAAYLLELREEFGPSLALVAAGYNAGPGRPRQWIPRLGDPRDPSVDITEWVERVPFAETRNYIMRVAESQVIYRARLAGSPQPIGMQALLRGQ